MNFNSISFGLFLPIVFILYWLSLGIRDNNKGKVYQNLILITSSYFFYACFDYRFMLLLLLATLFSYYVGKKIETSSKRYYWNLANIVLSVLVLIAFKYYNFFIESANGIVSALGFTPHLSTIKLIVPVGISFFLFQSMSYTIDIYKGKYKSYTLLDYFTYICFFPKLVAGPIERADHFIPQIMKARKFDAPLATDGLRQMLWGYFKKVLIADNCAIVVDKLWPQYQHLGGATLIVVALFFTVQIYADFSGYSDIAIGCAKLFGIKMAQNFNVPYFSRNIREFWRRWHMSLMRWFRDYIYFPLGGSRCSKAKSFRNTLIVFAVSGLWHGANWTYVVWGVYHAFLFLPLMIFGGNKYKDTVANGRLLPSWKELGAMCLTFILVCIGWIIFRADNITQAFDYITSIFSTSAFDLLRAHAETKGVVMHLKHIILAIFIMFIVEWVNRNYEHPLADLSSRVHSRFIRWSAYVLIAISIMFYAANHSEFIYAQF